MLVDEIGELNRIIGTLTESIAAEKLEQTDTLVPLMNQQLQSVIPRIAASYMREELQEQREDIQYWIQQMERVIQALSDSDLFALVDILHYELQENLKLYCEMIKRAGLENVL